MRLRLAIRTERKSIEHTITRASQREVCLSGIVKREGSHPAADLVGGCRSPSVIVAACVADKDAFRERARVAGSRFGASRQPGVESYLGKNIDTHDDRHRHYYQPRRRPCCLLQAQQAVAAAAVEAQTTLELPTRVTQCREANLRRAQPLVRCRVEVRLDQHVERVPRLDRMHLTNHLHEADAARSQAATKPRAAGSNDTTRYV